MEFVEAKTPAELRIKIKQLYIKLYVKKMEFQIVYDSARGMFVAFYHAPKNYGDT